MSVILLRGISRKRLTPLLSQIRSGMEIMQVRIQVVMLHHRAYSMASAAGSGNGLYHML